MKPPRKTLTRLAGVTLLAAAAVGTALADYSTTVLSQNPQGYWRLNATTIPAFNIISTNLGSVGSVGNGTNVASPVHELPGPFTGSTAVGLDGSSQYINVPHSSSINTSNFTFEIWVKPKSDTFFGYMASSVDFSTIPARSGWYLAQDDGSIFSAAKAYVFRTFYGGGTAGAATVIVPLAADATNTWTHLAFTHTVVNGTNVTLTAYTNGVPAATNSTTRGYIPCLAAPLTVGCRSTVNFFWPGEAAETTVYPTALSSSQLNTHYTTAMTTPANYQSTIQADAPVVYFRHKEPADTVAVNSSLAGTSLNGLYQVGTLPAQTGPRPATYPGFEASNYAVGFDSSGASVSVPPLNFNTNTVSMSAWVKATSAIQDLGAGIVVCDAGTTYAGLTIDYNFGGLALGYTWNDDGASFNWSPTFDYGFPTLPENDWAYVALVVTPTNAAIYLAFTNDATSFVSITNEINHVNEAFDGATLIGSDAADPSFSFNGNIDEVAVFNRALSAGELYSQYAAAVGGVAPKIFNDLLGPSEAVAVGDPLELIIDVGGSPDLVYVWQKIGSGTVGLTTNSGTFTIASAVLADAGTYEVTVTNASGSVTSQQVVVSTTVPVQPVIVSSEGFFNRTIYPTGSVHMAVTATGGGLKYQWYKNATPIPGQNAAILNLTGATAAAAGSYSISVTNSAGTATNGPATISVATVVSGSYEAAIVGSGPEAWWRFDESPGATTMLDAMGRHYGYYTNVTGGAAPTLGVPGALLTNLNTAATFGAGAVGIVPYSPILNQSPFTIEAWVRTPVLSGVEVPFAGSDASSGWAWANNAGNWNGYDPVNNQVAPLQDYDYGAPVVSNLWTYLVMSYDESTIIDGVMYPYRYYVNTLNPGYVWQGGDANQSGAFIVGGAGTGLEDIAKQFFNGQVDEVAVYSRRLLTAEIQSHFDARGVEYIVPSFTGQPLSQTLAVGKTVTFTGTAVGSPAPLVYQWFKDGAPITDETNSSYTISGVSFADVGSYILGVTNAAGSNYSAAATLTVVTPTGYANVTNDLVLHLRFDGDAQDSSGHANHGVPSVTTPPAYATGLIGSQAIELDTTLNVGGTAVQTASYVTLGTVGSGAPTDLQFGSTTSFSVGVWVKLPVSGIPGDVPFIGTETNAANNPGWFFGMSYQDGGWQWNLNDGAGNNIGVSGAENSINDGNWHHYLVTVDRTANLANAYIDGVLLSSRSIAGLGNINNNNYWPAVIGQDPTGLYPEASHFTLDDMGIWRRALTALDVVNIEAAGKAGNSFDTVAVLLTISQVGGNVVVEYPTGTLEQSDTVGAGAVWTTVPGASAPSYSTPPTNAAKYYRVSIP